MPPPLTRLRRLLRPLTRLTGGQPARSSVPLQIGLCAPLGLLVGLAVVAMHEAVFWLHQVDFALPDDAYLSAGEHASLWHIALVPAAGGLILGLLALISRRLRPRDIIDPVEANALYGGRMSLLDSLRLSLSTLVSNAAGASVGMEAAYSQFGAGFMSATGQSLNLRRVDLRIFVAAGAAAAIAAAFNAPLAGAFYGFELVLAGYTLTALAPVAMAALAGTLVVRATIGVAPIFLVSAQTASLAQWEYPLFGLLGVAAAGIGIATMQAVTLSERAFRALPTPDWMRPLIGGLCISAVAAFFPKVLGSGHGGIQALFDAVPAFLPLTMLLAAKLIASALSIGSGFRGGLFSSSLFIGCLFGAAASQGLGLFLPWALHQHAVFMLVGMGAVTASIVGAPITVVMLVLEISGDYSTTLAVLAGVVMSSTITRHAFGYSFATWRFHQQGKGIKGAYDVGWIADLTVGRMLRADVKTVRQDVPLARLRQLAPLGSRSRIFAVDQAGHYAGIIDLTVLHDPDITDAADGLVAGDLAFAPGTFLLASQNIRDALALFDKAEVESLPVLASAEDRRILGYATEAYALRRYAQELERRRAAELGEHNLFDIGAR